jgi:RimJ/RimL family protein N-acetyltransferase
MSKFIIKRSDPVEHKDQILKLWNENLSDTTPERFEWMQKGNPAGMTCWFLAFSEDTKELVGIISIMPKELFINDKTIKVGILGDFIVSRKYRTFGPALQLLNAIINYISDSEYELIYTIPNAKSEKLIKKIGFEEYGQIYYLVKPIKLQYYINKYTSKKISNTLLKIIGYLVKIISRETFVSYRGIFNEVNVIDNSFDMLWEKICSNQKDIVGNHCKEYLSWRYFQNPQFEFHIITYRETPQGDLLGYIIFVMNDNKLEIYDIITLNKKIAYKLIKRIVYIANQNDCKSIYITVGSHKSWLKMLKCCFFFDTKYNMKLFYVGKKDLLRGEWEFFAGDRNI